MSNASSEARPRPEILMVEDSPTQAAKLQHLLEQNDYQVSWAENGQRALEALEEHLPSLIISDIMMPEMDGYQFCKLVKLGRRTKQIPLILLTSLSRSEDVLEGLECGADYFITKPYSESYLLSSISQILLNREFVGKDRVRIGTEIMVGGKSRLITTDQQQTLSLLISTYEAAVRTNSELVEAQEDLRNLNAHLEDLVSERTAALSEEIEVRRQSEERIRHLNIVLRAIRGVNSLIVTEKDAQKLAREACRILMEHRGYENAFILLTNRHSRLVVHTAAGPNAVLLDAQAGGGDPILPPCCLAAQSRGGVFHVSDRTRFCATCPLPPGNSQSDVLCSILRHNGDTHGYLNVTMEPSLALDYENRELFEEMAADLASALHNIEQSKAMQQAEKDKQRIEAELRQAQKMEAVGRLAGGVAHDFNNMLGVILGYASMALDRLSPTDPLHDYLKQIEMAGERSADLARQLLAFSSRQMVTPKVVDLNDIIGQVRKMLVRLIGEDIEFKFDPQDDLWPLLIDPSQVNQVLANLAVNARDAIDGTGAITIETANVVLDEDVCRQYAQAEPGEYVLLAFSDTGVGMDQELVSHIFEPFFTTKDEGKGTGLGLSTVFGIVKQYDGLIHTYSEPGLGTTFKIYFPRFLGKTEGARREAEETPSHGSETVVVVEDEKQLLALAKAVLESYGHKVLSAGLPSDAIKLVRDYPGEIHLLLTDMVMPEMNGKDLQEKILALKPGIKTLFMSGYTADAIVHRGMLEEGVFFISKPFTVNALARKVRETLEA